MKRSPLLPFVLPALLLGSGGSASGAIVLSVRNESGGALSVVHNTEAWCPETGSYRAGQGNVRRILQDGEEATFRYQVAGKDLEGNLVVRRLGENGVVHYEGLTIRRSGKGAGSGIPAVGAQSLTEPLPAVADSGAASSEDEK